MKCKRIILNVFLTISSFVGNAQNLETSFGIKGGLNRTFFNVNQQFLGFYSTSQTGFYGGVFVEFTIDHFLSIQPEALYISVGDFNFLNVPIYAHFEVGNKLHLMVDQV